MRTGRSKYRIAWRALVVGLFALLALGFGASPAQAHASLEGTDPPGGSIADSAPTVVTMNFSERVVPVDGRVKVIAPDGKDVVAGKVTTVNNGARVRIPLKADLADGTYLVSYRVISADGHPVQGGFTFSSRVPSALGASATDVNSGAASASVDGGVRTVQSVSRFAAYAGVALLAGPLVILLGLWPRRLATRGPRRLAWTGWGLLFGGTLGVLLLQETYADGGTLADISFGGVGQSLDETVGRALAARLGLLIAAIPVLIRVLRPSVAEDGSDPGWAGPVDRVLVGILGLAVLVTFPFAGHAAQSPAPFLSVPAITLHVGAMAVWLGGLAVLARYLLPRARYRELEVILPVWSRWAFWAVAMLVFSGVIETFLEIGGFGGLDRLVNTTYGQLVLTKVIWLGAILVVAANARAWIRRRFGVPVAYALAAEDPENPPPAAGAAKAAKAAKATNAAGAAKAAKAAGATNAAGADQAPASDELAADSAAGEQAPGGPGLDDSSPGLPAKKPAKTAAKSAAKAPAKSAAKSAAKAPARSAAKAPARSAAKAPARSAAKAPARSAAETPTEAAAPETAAEAPADASAQVSGESGAKVPGEVAVPAEARAQAPADASAEVSGESVAKVPGEVAAETPTKSAAKASAERTKGAGEVTVPAESAAQAPSKSVAKAPAEALAQASAEAAEVAGEGAVAAEPAAQAPADASAQASAEGAKAAGEGAVPVEAAAKAPAEAAAQAPADASARASAGGSAQAAGRGAAKSAAGKRPQKKTTAGTAAKRAAAAPAEDHSAATATATKTAPQTAPTAATKNGPTAATKNGPTAATKNGPTAATKNGPTAATKNGPKTASKTAAKTTTKARKAAEPETADFSASGRSADEVRRLRSRVGIEVLLGAVVLALATALVQVAPARSAGDAAAAAANLPYSAQLTMGPNVLQVDLSPAHVGTNELHLTLFDQNGLPVKVAEWSGSADLPKANVSTDVVALPLTENHAVGQVELPIAGEWKFVFTARTSDIDQYSVEKVITIR
ncbi:copper resistance CopC/CopD family protein [Cryptosporangium sp. NPDC051539]|uniref:copper resistance CopC/CopD family protein n=1 Tax=Cryptosporangium sp. NPDC051539 TaxID=3363962 RepID=UPI0037BD1FE8